MVSMKRKNSQKKILNEIKTQLVLQAERWGRQDYYTPIVLEEMGLEQSRKILADLLSERANLEYELHLLGSDKHELLIKLERLEAYVKRARKVIERHQKNIHKSLEKMIGDKDKLKLIMRKMRPENNISVFIQAN